MNCRAVFISNGAAFFELPFHLLQDMVHVVESKPAKRYGDYFLRQIVKVCLCLRCDAFSSGLPRILNSHMTIFLSCLQLEGVINEMDGIKLEWVNGLRNILFPVPCSNLLSRQSFVLLYFEVEVVVSFLCVMLFILNLILFKEITYPFIVSEKGFKEFIFL